MKPKLRKELVDQSAHVAWCIVTLLPVLLFRNPLGFALTGFLCGLIREVTEEGTPFTASKFVRAIKNSKLDLLFWTIGGLLIGLGV